MGKIFSIAWNDYRQTVLTRTFIIGILLMPVVFFGIIFFHFLAGDNTDLKDRRIMIIDHTDVLFDAIEKNATNRNQGDEVFAGPKGDKKQVKPKYHPEEYTGRLKDDETIELELSERVRAGELFAFVIIGKNVIDPDEGEDTGMAYYSDSPSELELPDWLVRVINDEVTEIRFSEAGINQRLVNKLRRPVGVERLKLAQITHEGEVVKPERENLIESFTIPFGVVMLLFVVVNMSSPIMLNTVMEEKMYKIAEVLAASVPPFHLMLGKLLAATLVGITYAAVYLGSMAVLVSSFGSLFNVPASLYLWFFVFMIITLLIYGSMWAAIGAACSEMKDTQNFAGLTVLMIMAPMVLVPAVMQSPGSAFSVAVSLIPPLSPMVMLLRLAMSPGPETWEVALSLVLALAFALFCVWAGGRIFRIGFLAQGQSPRFGQLLRWMFFR